MAQKVQMQYADGFDAATNGRLFFGTSEQAGIALIVSATTGNHPSLWNKSSSGVNCFIRALYLTWLSGTNAPTGLEWCITESAGDQIGTGLPVVTFTTTTAGATKRSCLGGDTDTGSSLVLWSGKTNSYTAAPAFHRPTGLSQAAMAGTSTPAPFLLQAQYNGDLAIAPGNVLSLCSRAATTTSLYQVCVVWEEIPITA